MNTILFDLDGTLLPMDIKKFMHLYKTSLNDAFVHLQPEGYMFDYVMDSVKHTVLNTEKKKNYDKFFQHFEKYTNGNLDHYLVTFDEFYENGFESVKSATIQSQEMIASVRLLKEKGYRLIIATNPIFPMKANIKRIEWAGLNISDFDYISNFEDNHFCKPHLSFYQEVLDINNLDASQVLMVGNDVVEDLSIRNLGVKTFLIDDHLIPSKHKYETEYQGCYEDFYEFVLALKSLK